MGKIKVHAGDFFTVVKGDFSRGSFYLKSKKHPPIYLVFEEKIKAKKKLVSLELADEEAVRSVGFAIAATAMFGPIGLLASIMSKHKKKVTFVAKFSDGRSLLATTDKKTYKKIMIEYMKRKVK